MKQINDKHFQLKYKWPNYDEAMGRWIVVSAPAPDIDDVDEITLQRVVPGSVTITRRELQDAFMKATTQKEPHNFTSLMDLETELFGDFKIK